MRVHTKLEAVVYPFARLILMALVLVCPQWVFAVEWEPLVESLRSDDVRFNAIGASTQLTRLIYKEDSPGLREKLESLLEDPNYQMRQYASYLLADVYKRENIPEAQWPKALMRNIVEGLRQDRMNLRNTFPNAISFFRLLFDLEENHPIQLLKAELSGDDPQSRPIAAILLSRYEDESTLPERNEVLLKHLLDDGIRENAIAAYLALAHSGTENTRQLLEKFEPVDWQQAALIQCVASFHGMRWSPSDDSVREQWLEKARQPQSWALRERKFAMVALYLDPQGERFLQEKEIPEALDRMFKAGRSVKGAVNRMKWVAGWFPILDPDPPMHDYLYRSSTFVILMR